MASAIAQAYTGGPPAGSRGKAPGQRGGRSWSTFDFCTFNGSRKFAHFSKIWKRKEIRYMCYLRKKLWVATKRGGGGDGAPGPGLKPPLSERRLSTQLPKTNDIEIHVSALDICWLMDLKCETAYCWLKLSLRIVSALSLRAYYTRCIHTNQLG